MSEVSSPQFSWTCPACSRTVPNRVAECRCGAARPDPVGSPQIQEVDSATRSSSAAAWVVLGLVAIAAAGTLIALQMMPLRAPAPDATARDLTETKPAHNEAAAHTMSDTNPPPFAAELPGPSPSTAGKTPPGLAASPPEANNSTGSIPLEDVVSRSIPAIVSIETAQGRGSGFFAAPQTIVTNRHVIQNHVSVTVRLSSGQTLPGRVQLSSEEYDLAVVRVDSASPSQPLLPLGTVDEVRPGQEVIAIGLALGVFQNSVTRGIISAVRRTERTVMLQTDAAINPGNSGGPLLNRQGQVVGINTLKIGGAAESLGFAVAIDHAQGMLTGGRPYQPHTAAANPASHALAPAFTPRSSTDNTRAEGTRRYEMIVEVVARRANQLDGYWQRIKANCPMRVVAGYDREWFGLWDGRTTLGTPDVSCSSAMRDMGELAAEIRTAMATAREEARRASGLPGQLREIRRRYRMDWIGFE